MRSTASTLLLIKKTAIAVSIAIGSILISGCDANEAPQNIISTSTVRPALTEVLSHSTNAKLTFNGVVRSTQRADLAFRLSGRVIDVLVHEGQQVKKGQLLAQLDPRDAKTALDSAHFEFKNSEAEYTRGKAIYDKSQAIAKSDLDTLRTRYNVAKNRLTDAKRQLEYTQLLAPFDGIIGRKMVDNHVQIQANSPVLTVHNINDLEVLINIPDSVMLGDLKGSKALAQISALRNETFPLVLSTYGTQADPVTQTYPVVLTFEDLRGFNVLPGMAVKVVPVYPTDQAQAAALITVPLTAVVPDNQGGQFVWVVDQDNQVHQRPVTAGTLNANRIVIKAGLHAGERIVIAGVSSLKEGMKVKPYTDKLAANVEG
ncbi:efflux RND transporter periplasmic adaptor subunit [Photobacterium sanguinicancri]|uniref:efflux RND transporter periplasmic adaptor subunit n=1 Tax=Photobacterium sanguinicancri TaxID=875932 RepID=UPI00078918FB|nr:efflux RND transporter periplasmic adaptor subunit [Photobacterium sanguinicancri]KXI23835.1 hemolysin secretion protein D [Photobacterium sanguinicancri]